MVRWVEYCRKNSKDLLRPAAGFGDWLSIKADTPKDVMATAYFAHSTHLTADAARVLGKDDDARKYDELFQQIKAAFNKAYVAPDGRIKGNTQTCYVLALWFDLLPKETTRSGRYAISRRRHQVARHASVDRLRRHERADADALGDRQHAAGLQAAAERHVPLVGLSRSSTAPRPSGNAGTAGRRKRVFKTPA